MALFIVAYDIADPRRLRRVARIMERHALRTQRSVFLFQGTEQELERLLNRTSRVMCLREDLVQAWQLRGDEKWMGRYRGTPLWLCPQSAIAIGEDGSLCIVPRPSDLERTSGKRDKASTIPVISGQNKAPRSSQDSADGAPNRDPRKETGPGTRGA